MVGDAMFRHVKRLWSSTSELTRSAYGRANVFLRRQGFTKRSVITAATLVFMALATLGSVGGSAPPVPVVPDVAVAQVVSKPASSSMQANDANSLSGKVEFNLAPIQKIGENKINNSATHPKCGIHKTPSNARFSAQGDHVDVNFNLYLQKDVCAGIKLGSASSRGDITVSIRPYNDHGVLRPSSTVVRTHMSKMGGLKDIRSKVREDVKNTFKEQMDNVFSYELPKGVKFKKAEFTEVGGGEITATIYFSYPMPPSA